jgi:hypothetical protein
MSSDGAWSVNGFRFIGLTADGLWSKYIESDVDPFQQETDWEERRQQQEARRKAEAERKAAGLPAEARNRLYRRMLSELTLHPLDRADLRDRGLSDAEIKLRGVKSVQQWQKLETELPYSLPGVSLSQSSLNVQDGYLCPIYDVEGNLVAFQLRMREANDGGRYRWLTSKTEKRTDGATPHLPDTGELPLAVFRPYLQEGEEWRGCRIALVEGTGAKPFILSQRVKVATIGAAGGNFAGSPETLKRTLEKLAEEFLASKRGQLIARVEGLEAAISKAKTLYFFPDSGSVLNPHVLRQYRSTWELLESWGYQIEVAWWDQIEKSVGDIDELENFNNFYTITSAEFWDIAARHGYDPNQSPPKPISLEELAWRKAKQFTPAVTTNSQYFDLDVPEPDTLTFVKAGLGNGKTTWTGKVIEAVSRQGEGVIYIAPHNSLLIQTASKLDLYHLNFDGGRDMLPDRSSRIALCPDSLPKLKASDFVGRTLIVDEWEGVKRRLLSDETAIARWRDEAIERFSQGCQLASRVIYLDALMSDESVEFAHQFCPDKQVVKVENVRPSIPWKIKFYDCPNRAQIAQAIDQAVSSGKRFAIATDSQNEAEAWDRSFGCTGLRVDSTTKDDLNIKDFLRDPDSYIQRVNPRYIIYTPCAESGLSIDIRDYFSDLFVVLFGVLTTNQQLQMAGRLRDPDIQRHFWSPERGIVDSRSISGSTAISKLEQELENYLVADVAAAIEGVGIEQLEERLHKVIEDELGKPQSKAFLQGRAIENYERKRLRECLRICLTEAGHSIEVITDEKKPLPEDLKRHKEEVKRDRCRGIFTAPDLTEAEAKRLSVSSSATFQQQLAVEKFLLKQRLPGIEQQSDWGEDLIYLLKFGDGELLKNLEDLYLINHPEIAKLISQRRWARRLADGFIPLEEVKSRYLKIKTLLDLGFTDFLSPDAEWTKGSDRLQEFYNQCRKPGIESRIGRQVGERTPVEWIAALLEDFGLKLLPQQRRIDGVKKRFYRLASADDLREKLQKQLDQADSEAKVTAIEMKLFRLQVIPQLTQCIEKRYTTWMTEKSVEEIDWQAMGSQNQVETVEKNTADFRRVEQAETITQTGLEGVPPFLEKDIYISEEGWDRLEVSRLDDSDRTLSKSGVSNLDASGLAHPAKSPESTLVSNPFPVERGQRVKRRSDGRLFQVTEVVDGQLWVKWLNQVLSWNPIILPWSEVELTTA